MTVIITKEGEQSPFVICPCCHGEKFLLVHDANRPDDPPARVMCCHCTNGIISTDNRSMNVDE
jgi:hypothetical protein